MFKISIIYLLLLQSAIGFAQQNCIIIIADDVSPDYFASFSTTTDVAQTPNISALAQNGVRFTNAWATPVCSPTRAGLLTGRYSFRTGVGEVITNNATPQLDTAEVTIAELLQQHAPTHYNTGLAGKWHLHSNTAAKRLYPNRMGFDFYKGSFSGALQNYYTYPIVVNGATDTSYQYATTQTINDALSWMDTMNATKPFFLCMAFNAPHSPYHLPPSSLCDVAGLTGTTAHINANKKLYFKAAIQALDTEIGRLLQYLNDNGFGSNTNIIIMGDNGNSQDVAQGGNGAHAKGTIYDYGVHVPLIVNGPAVVSPNRNCTELVNTHDIFATVAELCAFPNWRNAIPASTPIDSKSFLPHLQNQNITVRNWIFTEKFTSTPVATDGKTIRNNQYQLLRFDNGTTEFYDLQADINQNNNLLGQSLTAAQQMNHDMLCDTLDHLLATNWCVSSSAETAETSTFSAFPNPCSDVLSLHFAENFTGGVASFYNTLGEECLSVKLTSASQKINTTSLKSGIYTIKITYQNRIVTTEVQVLSRQ